MAGKLEASHDEASNHRELTLDPTVREQTERIQNIEMCLHKVMDRLGIDDESNHPAHSSGKEDLALEPVRSTALRRRRKYTGATSLPARMIPSPDPSEASVGESPG